MHDTNIIETYRWSLLYFATLLVTGCNEIFQIVIGIGTRFIIIILSCTKNDVLVYIHQPKALYDTIWKLTTFPYNVGHILYWPCIFVLHLLALWNMEKGY